MAAEPAGQEPQTHLSRYTSAPVTAPIAQGAATSVTHSARQERGGIPQDRQAAESALQEQLRIQREQLRIQEQAVRLAAMRKRLTLDDPAYGDGVFLPVAAERRDLDVLPGLGCLDEQAGADVHADVARVGGRAVGAGYEQQVSGLELGV
jgi:hypothetical protein